MAETCGAKTRGGWPCKRAPSKGAKRCKLHGGASTGAPKENSNAATHGFYSDALTADEKPLWERIQIGSIDDEIRLMRVKLHRLVKLSGSADVAELIDSALEVAQKRDTHPRLGAFDKSEIKVKAPQYAELILQAVGELRKLELQRLQMRLIEKKIEEGGGSDGDEHEVVGFEVVPYAD